MPKQKGTRICAICNEPIFVGDLDNLDNVAYFKSRYCHKDCLIREASVKAGKNNGRSEKWKSVLDHIDDYVAEAHKLLEHKINLDNLNDYLISTYDVALFSSSFWTCINEIGNGIYRNQRCVQIDCKTLLNMWQFYEHELYEVHKYLMRKGTVIHGESKARYDLAIIMSKYNEYKRKQAKLNAEALIRRQEIRNMNDTIDYTTLPSRSREKERVKDMSAFLEDLY